MGDRTTPKNLEGQIVERFLELAPIAAKWTKRATGNKMAKHGYTKEDLINDAYVSGHWWQYHDRSDGFFLTIIKFDMMKALSKWTNTYKVYGGSGKTRISPKINSLDFLMEEGFDKVCEGKPTFNNIDEQDLVSTIIENSKLSKGELHVIKKLYWEGKSMSEVARDRGVQPGTDIRLHDLGMVKLKRVAERTMYNDIY